MTQLPQILKMLMQEQQLTPSKLAQLTGIGQPVIFRILSGETYNPKVCSLSPIANYFGVSISQLIGDAPLTARVPMLAWQQVQHWPQNKNIALTEFIYTQTPHSKNAFALTVQDTSMEPVFPQETVLIFEATTRAEHRNYVLAHHACDKQVTFKQLVCDTAKQYLKPLNPDFAKQQAGAEENFTILGVLIEARMCYANR